MHTQRVASHESAHGIDLAPMLDFAINLLVFFIITAVFVKESGINVRRPTTGDDHAAKPVPTLAVLANGDVVIDGRAVDIRAVRANVERLRAIDAGAGMVIVADSRAPTGALVGVIDEIHLGGIFNITFSTTE